MGVMVAGLLAMLCWSTVVLVLTLPLTVGRMLVRSILATQAARISDFLPLSLGVVVFSAVVLAVVKVCEALPTITAHIAALEHRRCMHVVMCLVSSLAIAIAALI